MESQTITRTEFRNNLAEVVRRAEAGTELTITVRGRPVACLRPLDHPCREQPDIARDSFRTPVDDAFAREIAG